MKERLLPYLACPSCGGDIELGLNSRRDGSEIMDGELGCTSCSRTFQITSGVPRFAELDKVEVEKAVTAQQFGWSWQHFTQRDERYAEQFLGWITPVEREFFKDKLVVEGGCGKGRHTRLAAAWGARDVIAVDLSDAVNVAFEATRDLENAHVIQADLFHLPLRRVFDYAFSVGVLHHLPDPQAGFTSLASKVRIGGHVSAWVYGAENNGWIRRFVNPLRKHITTRIHPRALLHLSKLPAAALYAATKLVYGPLNRSGSGTALARRLFYNDYMTAISDFGWREQHTIVFDHLVAPTAFYISREEFAAWWQAINACDVTINWHNRNSWCGIGRLTI
jgi:SAM-dependent methyltransferase/uncharacterized protein YbaR (Trm112 family)